jgi:hypothetical protein
LVLVVVQLIVEHQAWLLCPSLVCFLQLWSWDGFWIGCKRSAPLLPISRRSSLDLQPEALEEIGAGKKGLRKLIEAITLGKMKKIVVA